MFTGLSSRLPIDAVKNPRRIGKFAVARTDSAQSFTGTQTFAAQIIGVSSGVQLGANTTAGFGVGAGGTPGAYYSSSQVVSFAAGGASVGVAGTGSFGFFTGSISGVADLYLTRKAAANLRQGAADAAVPVAQTSSVQSVATGTSNTAGVTRTYTGSQSTGNQVGGGHVFQTSPAGAPGTAQNALVTAFTINGDGTSTFANNQYGQLGTAAGVVVSLPRSYSAVYNG